MAAFMATPAPSWEHTPSPGNKTPDLKLCFTEVSIHAPETAGGQNFPSILGKGHTGARKKSYNYDMLGNGFHKDFNSVPKIC